MEYNEIWGIPANYVHDFLRRETTQLAENQYKYKECLISLTVLPPKGLLRIPQTQVVFKGSCEHTEEIHKKFFLNFLSAGG